MAALGAAGFLYLNFQPILAGTHHASKRSEARAATIIQVVPVVPKPGEPRCRNLGSARGVRTNGNRCHNPPCKQHARPRRRQTASPCS